MSAWAVLWTDYGVVAQLRLFGSEGRATAVAEEAARKEAELEGVPPEAYWTEAFDQARGEYWRDGARIEVVGPFELES